MFEFHEYVKYVLKSIKLSKISILRHCNETSMNSTKEQLFQNTSFKWITLTILWTGILLRAVHFLYNRSLWMDEIYLSSSFSHISYKGLATDFLDYGQKAPLGFLWLVKLSVVIFGYTEFALRLIPFISALGSLFLWQRLCKRYLKDAGQLVALSIFCFAPALIYHSVEIKQYSMELFITVIVLYLYSIYHKNHTWKGSLMWGFHGALCIWFSFPIIFILCGIMIYTCTSCFLKKDSKPFKFYFITFTIWTSSFLINYFLFTQRHNASSEWVVYFFKTYDNFLPLFPNSISELKWYIRNYFQFLDYPLGLVWDKREFHGVSPIIILQSIVPTVLLFTGIYALNKKKSELFYSCTIAILLTLIASGLYLYPLGERFWVFICPIFIIFIAKGHEFCVEKKSFLTKISTIIFIIIIPVSQSLCHVFQPNMFYKHKKSYLKEALLNIDRNFKNGDVVYNYWNNAPGYKVYKNILPLRYKAIQGQDFRKKSTGIFEYNRNLASDFSWFRAKKRIWLVYNTQFLTDIGDLIDEPSWYYKSSTNPESNLIKVFDIVGKPIRKFVYSDITIYLFEIDVSSTKKSSSARQGYK